MDAYVHGNTELWHWRPLQTRQQYCRASVAASQSLCRLVTAANALGFVLCCNIMCCSFCLFQLVAMAGQAMVQSSAVDSVWVPDEFDAFVLGHIKQRLPDGRMTKIGKKKYISVLLLFFGRFGFGCCFCRNRVHQGWVESSRRRRPQRGCRRSINA